jgi:ribose 5-phosphate isomerase B
MARQLISERDILDVEKRGKKTISVPPDAIVTAAARDKATSLGIKLIPKTEQPPQKSARPKPKGEETIAIGSDHGGFQMKQALIPFVEGLGYRVVDIGTYTEEPCDYPDFAYMVARTVSIGEATRGIMIDAVGTASAMVANKVSGIRAACCFNEFTAKSSREHNDANVLTLGGRILGAELAKSIVTVWLETWFGGGRHAERLKKLEELERRAKK